MTKSQKNSVDEMLAVGISIPKIAAFLHVSQNSIKSYLQRNHPNDVCRNCGTPVLQVPHRKQKKFCCDACRMHYWNTHPQEMRHENAATIPCAFCGTPVLSYRNHPRKYCSRACAAKGRYQRRKRLKFTKYLWRFCEIS